jgi:hypothetical protein
MPRPFGLGHGRLTISPASANVMLLTRRIADLTPDGHLPSEAFWSTYSFALFSVPPVSIYRR